LSKIFQPLFKKISKCLFNTFLTPNIEEQIQKLLGALEKGSQAA